MTIHTNNPVRVRIDPKVIPSILPQRVGAIDIHWEQDPTYPNDNVWLVQFIGSDTLPFNPSTEVYEDDIDRELERLSKFIIQDRVRERLPLTLFPKSNHKIVESIIDEKRFAIENRYDLLLDKPILKDSIHSISNIHFNWLANRHKQVNFGRIE